MDSAICCILQLYINQATRGTNEVARGSSIKSFLFDVELSLALILSFLLLGCVERIC